MPGLFSPAGGFILEGFQTHCSFNYISRDAYTRNYMILLFIFGFILPLVLIIIFYFLIWKYYKKSMKLIIFQMKPMITINQNSIKHIHSINTLKTNRKEKRLIKSILLIVITFCIAWTPYALVTLVAQFSSNFEAYINPFTTNLPALFAKLSSVYNPIIYILNNKKCRNLIRESIFSKNKKAIDNKTNKTFNFSKGVKKMKQINEINSKTCVHFEETKF